MSQHVGPVAESEPTSNPQNEVAGPEDATEAEVLPLGKRRLPRLSKKRLLLLGCALVAGVALGGFFLKQHWTTSAAFDGLEDDTQDYIWHCEHIAFELETHFGKPFTKALMDRNEAVLRRCFLESFVGQTLDWTDGQTRRHGIVSEIRCDAATAKRQPVDTAEMVEYLLALAKRFDRTDRVKLRVLHNDLVDPATGTWELRLLLNLVGTAGGAPAEIVSEQRVVARFSNDEEIKAGRILGKWQVESQTRRRSEHALMEEVTEQVGLSQLPLVDNWKIARDQMLLHRRQIAVEDFDLDGDLDLAIATVHGERFVLRSIEAKRFEVVTQSLGVRPRPIDWAEGETYHDLSLWFDYDNDGFPDLLLGERLYRNEQGKKFRDVTEESGLRFQSVFQSLHGAVVADYDGDGRLDLYLLYGRGKPEEIFAQQRGWVGDDVSGGENQLWRNLGNGRFRDVTTQAGASGGRRQSFAAACLHLDDDTLPDLYIANDFGSNVLLHNRGDGTFEDITQKTGAGDFATSMGVSAGDLDNDGTTEIYVANMFSKMGRRIIAHVRAEDYPHGVFEQILGSCAGNRLYRKRPGQQQFEEISEAAGVNAVGWAFAPAMADLDGDGLLDLYATAGFISVDRHKPDG